ncbi:MAG: cytochrome c [Myxococcales bacterium]|nr:cytochrome c [Myxococcales bacterium]MCB9568084.1 cytochrome c [Myxococcales bacterium]MCB9705310.1 cytochrome c [Myxococcales bacterium]
MRRRGARICPGLGAGLLALGLALGACAEPPPRFTEAMVLGGVEVSVDELNAGAKLYGLHCASCHGFEGKGDGPAARHLNPGPRDLKAGDFVHKSTPGDALPTDADLLRVLREGLPGRGMPAWGGMRDEDLRALVAYIKTLSPRWREPVSDPQRPSAGSE